VTWEHAWRVVVATHLRLACWHLRRLRVFAAWGCFRSARFQARYASGFDEVNS